MVAFELRSHGRSGAQTVRKATDAVRQTRWQQLLHSFLTRPRLPEAASKYARYVCSSSSLLHNAAACNQDALHERRLSSLSASTSEATERTELGETSALPTVQLCLTHTLPAQATYECAVEALRAALTTSRAYDKYASGVVRYEVPLPIGSTALQWLKGQLEASGASQLGVYFSPRRSSAPATPGTSAAQALTTGGGPVSGVGAAWKWQGQSGKAFDESALGSIAAFMSHESPRVRALGGSRFDCSRAPSEEWMAFGSYCFILPRLEFSEASTCNILACTLAWHQDARSDGSCKSLGAAMLDAQYALAAIRSPSTNALPALQIKRGSMQHLPDKTGWQQTMQPLHDSLKPSAAAQNLPPLGHVEPSMALKEYESSGQGGLDALLAALDGASKEQNLEAESGLTKVVLARRSDVKFMGNLRNLDLLQTLQERDPRAYQLALHLPNGATFLSSTPEMLYERSGACVASEAVAGTRPRGPAGDVEKDFWLAFDLLRNPKDHAEFTLVRDWVKEALKNACSNVSLDTEKSVLKQGSVQHLYGRLSGRLRPDCNDSHLLAALHPTPAVCGRPQWEAKEAVAKAEPFDRGFYSGPFGWISGAASEFAVAIRSALVHPLQEDLHDGSWQDEARWKPLSNESSLASANAQQLQDMRQISLYAGVGIVKGSVAESEWQELNLKIRQFDLLLRQPVVLQELPNVNQLWARLMVEELCRLGCNVFCIAPGSRSSPLTTAVAMQPTAQIVSCIDERSLAFWALGYGRAKGRPAVVITSSGTAVANLFPAVVEAAQSGVPLLILSADRPAELRDTGANQTIDQVKLFGSYPRWTADLPPPSHAVPARAVLTTVDNAIQNTTSPAGGPVHVNCQFREPLGLSEEAWSAELFRGLRSWERGPHPFSQPLPDAVRGLTSRHGTLPKEFIHQLKGTKRGLMVVGEQLDPAEAVACLNIASSLGWPLAADISSGLKVGAGQSTATVIQHLDLILCDREAVWSKLCPEIILQVGGHLVSKRALQFLEWATIEKNAEWIYVDPSSKRHDVAHCISKRLQIAPHQLADQLLAEL